MLTNGYSGFWRTTSGDYVLIRASFAIDMCTPTFPRYLFIHSLKYSVFYTEIYFTTKEGLINEEIVRRYPGSNNNGGNNIVDKGKE